MPIFQLLLIGLILAVFLGMIPAHIASQKGHSFMEWWFFGTLLWIIALPASFIVSPTREGIERQAAAQGMMKCGMCAELVKAEAKVCKHCGHIFGQTS